MQQRLKSLPRLARTWIVAAELLDQFLLAPANETKAALDVRLAWETLTPLGRALESKAARRIDRSSSSVLSSVWWQAPPQLFDHGGVPISSTRLA
jgi:hypothetical protein